MATHAARGIHAPAGWRRRFSAYPLQGWWTRPSREGSARANFCSSQSCVWVQLCHHFPWAGPWPWAEAWAWVCVVGALGLVAVVGPGESSYSCAVGVHGEWGRGRTRTRGYARTISASAGAALAGHLLDVGRHRGLVGGRGRCWLALAFLQSNRGSSVVLGCGL